MKHAIYSWRGKRLAVIITGIALLCMSLSAVRADRAARATGSAADLGLLSLEDLMNLEVTSVSKKAEKLSDSAAAVYVVTQEDIRRSGATSIADALRMVPGLHVATVNSHTWAISSRGFNDRFANKMLVLIDGRSVYTPLFSGTWWDAQDTLMEDIDRIEVIRGPGATMWGANAVNGVINIITKKATDTQGMFMASDSGSVERFAGSLRYGGALGLNSHYRLYTKYFDRGDFADSLGNDGDDSWTQSRTGFRMDRDISDTDNITVHGDVYSGSGNQRLRGNSLVAPYDPIIVDKYDYSGANVLARWARTPSDTSETALQLYVDRTERNDAQHYETRDTWDFDYQSRSRQSERREVMWGIGYRVTSDSTKSTSYTVFDPGSATDRLLNAFVQQDLALVEKKLRLTLGSKFEHNGFTGVEIQPNVRLLWTLNDRHTVWAAASRAVRTPNRGEADALITLRVLPPGPEHLPYKVEFVNNQDLKSEKLTAYEMGYRFQPGHKLSFDVAAFYNNYRDLRTLEPEAPYPVFTPVPHIVVPFRWGNMATAHDYGVELASNWQLSRSWKMALGYTWHKRSMDLDALSGDVYTRNAARNTPKRQFNLRSYVDLSDKLAFDTLLYCVGPVPAHNVPGYVRFDMRLAWQSGRDTDVILVAQNLFDKQHQEFGGTLSELPMEVPRTVYVKLARKY